MVRRLLPLLAALAGVVVWTAPAAAHPFGPPPTAKVSAAGRTITVEWAATPDDAVAIGEKLGVMPEGSVALYRQDSAAQVAPSAEDEAKLSASPKLRRYLSSRVVAVQDGTPCRPEVPRIPDFVHAGATVVLQCPEPVEDVTLRIELLHDIHDAYRTVATGTQTDPAQSVFTVSDPEHAWRFGVDPGADAPLPVAIGMGAVAATTIAAVVLVTRRMRGQA